MAAGVVFALGLKAVQGSAHRNKVLVTAHGQPSLTRVELLVRDVAGVELLARVDVLASRELAGVELLARVEVFVFPAITRKSAGFGRKG